MFHKHKWEVIKTTYSPPMNINWSSYLTMSEFIVERLTMGLTTYLVQCSICKKLNKHELLGNELEKSNGNA